MVYCINFQPVKFLWQYLHSIHITKANREEINPLILSYYNSNYCKT